MPSMPIYVTQPYLPPLEEFIPYLQQIWDNKILTNNGPFHRQLKIDIEGMEPAALRGGKGLLEKYKPDLFVEISSSD